MSLTKVVETKEVREFMTPLLTIPRLDAGSNLRVASVAPSPSRIGTAFDYLLRFGLAARGLANPRGTTVAQGGAERLTGQAKRTGLREVARAEQTLLASAGAESLDPAGAEAALVLAAYDLCFRPGRADDVGRTPVAQDISELQALHAIVPWEEFRPVTRTLLNPTFGMGSQLVGGGDGDLIVDDLLIDIKTTKDSKVTPSYIRQLVGYALLANRYGIDDDPVPGSKIRRVGIYFSRVGKLVRADLDAVVRPPDQATVLKRIVQAGVPFRRVTIQPLFAAAASSSSTKGDSPPQ